MSFLVLQVYYSLDFHVSPHLIIIIVIMSTIKFTTCHKLAHSKG